MTSFTLKMIALVTMVLDHIKYAVPAANCFLTKYFGRISFPIFSFLIAEGLIHTKDRKKYFLRMFIFACISQIPFMMFRSLVANKFLLNIMFTFLFGISAIFVIEFFKKHEELPSFFKFVATFVAVTTIIIAGFLIPVDYNWFGVTSVIFFYIFREKKFLRTIAYFLLVILYYITVNASNLQNINILSVIFTMLPGIIILFYNGKEGKKFKYFFYIFYPLHMLIIYGLSLIFL